MREGEARFEGIQNGRLPTREEENIGGGKGNSSP